MSDPNDLADLGEVSSTALEFEQRSEEAALSEWKFTREDLHKLMERLEAKEPPWLA